MLGAPAGAAGAEVEDRLASLLADALDQRSVELHVLRRRARRVARVQMDDRRTGAPALHRRLHDLIGGEREVGRVLPGSDAAGHRGGDHHGIGHLQ